MLANNRTSWSRDEVTINVPAYPGGFPSVAVPLTAQASIIDEGSEPYPRTFGASSVPGRRRAEAVVAGHFTTDPEDEGGFHDVVNRGTLPSVADREQFEWFLGNVHHGLRNGTIVEAKLPTRTSFGCSASIRSGWASSGLSRDGRCRPRLPTLWPSGGVRV